MRKISEVIAVYKKEKDYVESWRYWETVALEFILGYILRGEQKLSQMLPRAFIIFISYLLFSSILFYFNINFYSEYYQLFYLIFFNFLTVVFLEEKLLIQTKFAKRVDPYQAYVDLHKETMENFKRAKEKENT